MRFITKVLADCAARSGQATPIDEPEVPMSIRNPYASKFVERLLLSYQQPPTGHPYNSVERGFTPDLLQKLERARMMSEDEKIKSIIQRDLRWVRK